MLHYNLCSALKLVPVWVTLIVLQGHRGVGSSIFLAVFIQWTSNLFLIFKHYNFIYNGHEDDALKQIKKINKYHVHF